MDEYIKDENNLGLVHWRVTAGGDSDPVTEYVIEDADVRVLWRFVEQAARGDVIHPAVRQLMDILRRCVHDQAAEIGYADHYNIGESRLSSAATPLWRDGYEEGQARAMHDIAAEEALKDSQERSD